ncbi:MAG: hypothetical protein ACREBR_02175, partial [bacterium]
FDDQCIDFVGATCSSINKNIKRAANELAIPAGCTYEGVLVNSVFDFDTQPPVAHRFCFACKTVPHHWPASCDVVEKWIDKISVEMGLLIGRKDDEEGAGNADNSETFQDVAHRLWIKANTRPCPKCKAPIEKNDGCNHMICSNRHCHYEFW